MVCHEFFMSSGPIQIRFVVHELHQRPLPSLKRSANFVHFLLSGKVWKRGHWSNVVVTLHRLQRWKILLFDGEILGVHGILRLGKIRYRRK